MKVLGDLMVRHISCWAGVPLLTGRCHRSSDAPPYWPLARATDATYGHPDTRSFVTPTGQLTKFGRFCLNYDLPRASCILFRLRDEVFSGVDHCTGVGSHWCLDPGAGPAWAWSGHWELELFPPWARHSFSTANFLSRVWVTYDDGYFNVFNVVCVLV